MEDEKEEKEKTNKENNVQFATNEENDEIPYSAVDPKSNALKTFRTSAVLNPVRKIISKDRVRFKAGNIDLDLTYITPEVVGKYHTFISFNK